MYYSIMLAGQVVVEVLMVASLDDGRGGGRREGHQQAEDHPWPNVAREFEAGHLSLVQLEPST